MIGADSRYSPWADRKHVAVAIGTRSYRALRDQRGFAASDLGGGLVLSVVDDIPSASASRRVITPPSVA